MKRVGRFFQGFGLAGAMWLMAMGLPSTVFAQLSFYGIDTSYTLWKINASNQTAVSIGSVGSVFFEGLAMSPGGVLYGTDTNGILYSINTQTGATTAVGSTGRGDIEGIRFNGNTLVGVSFSNTPTFFSINTATGATTDIITAASSLSSVTRDLTFLNGTTALVTSFNSPDDLYSISLTTGAVTLVGSLAVTPGQFLGMDFGSNGILYGFNGDGNLYQINPATAAVTLLGNTGNQFWLDAAFAVPEPATSALLGFGVGALLIRRRRRFARARLMLRLPQQEQ